MKIDLHRWRKACLPWALAALVSAALGSICGPSAHAEGGPVATPTVTLPTTKQLPATACSTSLSACSQYLLLVLNLHRKAVGAPPLHLLKAQSSGASSCVGSLGHSRAMARSHTIWHINIHYPRASFPHDVCVPAHSAGENVGMMNSGSVQHDLTTLDAAMMSEPHDAATCSSSLTHACNILNPSYRSIGIGIYLRDGYTWLTEDFLG